MNDFAQSQGEIGQNVNARDDFQDGKVRDGGERMWFKLQCGRSGPGTFYLHVLQVVLDELANSRATIDMWDDLEQVIGGF